MDSNENFDDIKCEVSSGNESGAEEEYAYDKCPINSQIKEEIRLSHKQDS